MAKQHKETVAEGHEDSFVSHPTGGLSYTRHPDAVVPSRIRVGDVIFPKEPVKDSRSKSENYDEESSL